MKNLVIEKNFEMNFHIESAGTAAYHTGKSPDSRMRATANRHHIDLTSKAQQFTKEDFNKFDLILAMDKSNYQNIVSLAQTQNEIDKVILMRHFDEITFQNTDVPDPYYGGDAGFENVYQILTRCCTNLLESILNKDN